MASHAGPSRRNQSGIIHIFDITVRLNARRQLQSVTMLINDYERDVTWRKRAKDTLTAAFEPSLVISTSEYLELRIHSSLFRIGSSSISDKEEPVHIPANQLMSAHLNQQGHREWKRTYEKAEIIIRLSHDTTSRPSVSNSPSANVASTSRTGLTPTTDDIALICPRFRILVAGRTGVGKSSLINGAFGVRDALVSHDRAGKADINREIFSSQNQRFVLHDSQGFEPGEISNPGTVRGFIQYRNNMPSLKDKLHAIWVCIAIPVAGGRVFETGLEDLFRLKNEGQLGNTPIIAVFTKFDELVTREDRKLNSPQYDELSDEELEKLAYSNANKAFVSECLRVFQSTVGRQIPYKAVSTKQGYESTLSDLIQITFDNVKEHVAKEASIVTAIAQKVNPSVKIDGSIDVGRRRYWAGLTSSINFPGKTLEACLSVIHTDIINVWNLEDPNMNLHSKQFKSLMTHLVGDNVELDNAASPHKSLTAGLAMLGTLAGIVSALAGPAAPIVIPIAGCLVMAKWAYDVYHVSRNTLEHLMAYIIDLTLVMQNIFWISEGKHPVSRRLIKLAFKAYLESETKGAVHRMIAHHVKQAKTFAPGARDITLDKIVEIIDLYRIESAEMWTLKGKIPPFDALGSDEPWDLRKATK